MKQAAPKKSPPRKPLSPEDQAICANLRRIWNERQPKLRQTQESVAAAMRTQDQRDGVTQGAISNWLNGHQPIPLARVFWLAELLRVHPCDIDPNLPQKLPPSLVAYLRTLPPADGLISPATTVSYSGPGPSTAYSIHSPRA